MRVVLVHYHLRQGGVTSVMLNQARALAKAGIEFLIIAGEPPQEDMGFPFVQIEALAYDPPRRVFSPVTLKEKAEAVATGILRAIEERWGSGAGADCVVHVHNPLIQKNALLIPALNILAGKGLRLFLQNHDLAEDFRPDVYTGAVEYPENCHYGVINSRDYDFLLRAGLQSGGLHLIPNEVSAKKATEGLERTRYLYPVRAIRRKNIGEALLLSLFIPPGRTVAITLPPAGKGIVHYGRWVTLAAALRLPVEFDVGLKNSLIDLLGSSVCALSTSVKEGFGFSFLEPWTAGRGLFGRRIGYVCADFEQAGVRFGGLYNSIEIPLEYLSDPWGVGPVSVLTGKMETALRRIYRSFGLNVPDCMIEALSGDLANRQTIDFGRLDEDLQENLIRACRGDPWIRRHIASLNPLLENLGGWQVDEALIEANRRIIAEQYGAERIAALLFKIYQAVLDHPVNQRISKPALLEQYLDPLRLSLIGIGDG